MKSVGNKINIKTISEIQEEGLVDRVVDGKVIVKNPCKWIFTGDEPYLGKTRMVIEEVDTDDPKIPYRVNGGFWIPEFLVKNYVEPEQTPTEIPTVTPTEGPKVKYGKLFKFLIKLEKASRNTTVIKQTNINRLSALPEVVLDYIQTILNDQYPDYEIAFDKKAENIFNFINALVE